MPANIWVLIPIMFLLIPIVAILTRHQQKMAEIYHRGISGQNEVSAMRQEIAELKSLMHQQAINADTLSSMGRTAAVAQPPQFVERPIAG